MTFPSSGKQNIDDLVQLFADEFVDIDDSDVLTLRLVEDQAQLKIRLDENAKKMLIRPIRFVRSVMLADKLSADVREN